ncbi:MAG TPA: POT family MFS transporter [Chthoniobacterales bacterium]|jgi:POT family proton-dependent oligopeptide transporter|nr:POT family MFS transporter [Chthoniobacterales bacterium]
MAKHKYLTSPPNISRMPPGVPYIIGNEAAERFSYYGMKSVLTVFMAHYILNQSGVLAPMRENEAYMYTHYFVFGVYFLPVLGAILADGWIGKYWTILSLSVVYSLGNLTLACMATTWGVAVGQRTMLAIGLFLICLGAGGIKPCVSANVGDQFGKSNQHLLSKMFGWFYFSINAGSFIASLLCPWLLANPKWGPGWAFGVPGIMMVIATLFFWGGRKKMVHVPPGGLGYLKETFSREGLITLGRIAMVYVFILVFWALWGMSNGVEWTLQAEKMDLHWMGMNLIAAQVQTANPIFILLFIPLVNYVIYPAIDKVFPLTPLRKIGIGLFLTGLSFVVIVWIQGQIDAGLRPSINWQLLAYAVLTLGEAMVSITGLEFSYTQAPNTMKSSVMALWLFTVAGGELFVGLFNGWVLNADGTRKLTNYQYFEFFTVLMFVTAVVFVIVARFYKGQTYLQSQELTPDEVATEPILHGGTPS